MSNEFKVWFTVKRVRAIFVCYLLLGGLLFASCLDLYDKGEYIGKLIQSYSFSGLFILLLFFVFWLIDQLETIQEITMSKEEETQEFMLKLADARINKLVEEVERLTKELEEEKAIVKGLQDYANQIDDFEIAILDAKDKRKKH